MRLGALSRASGPIDMAVPSWRLHPLHGDQREEPLASTDEGFVREWIWLHGDGDEQQRRYFDVLVGRDPGWPSKLQLARSRACPLRKFEWRLLPDVKVEVLAPDPPVASRL
jgi:hypothetical protein